MESNRVEAFSDGVIAIIITIMVLELKLPHGSQLSDLAPMWPIFLSYVLSFIYIGIYWNNHHHMFQTVKTIRGRTLWLNTHLLFWLSLVPFATAWAGENHFTTGPMALYGFVLFMAGVAYMLLQRSLISDGATLLAQAVGSDLKGKISPVLYAVAIGMAFVEPKVSFAIYIGAAVMWFVPDPRIEGRLRGRE